MPRIVHFELPADDPERAARFYEQAFGWRIEKWQSDAMDYWMIMTGEEGEPGIDGGMGRRQYPGEGVSVTLDVEDVDAALERIVAAGGTIAVPKMAVPGVGWLAYVKDTEGHVIGLMADDPTAGT
jgi:predicted enzyme related to lactoylglutathione lyase